MDLTRLDLRARQLIDRKVDLNLPYLQFRTVPMELHWRLPDHADFRRNPARAHEMCSAESRQEVIEGFFVGQIHYR